MYSLEDATQATFKDSGWFFLIYFQGLFYLDSSCNSKRKFLNFQKQKHNCWQTVYHNLIDYLYSWKSISNNCWIKLNTLSVFQHYKCRNIYVIVTFLQLKLTVFVWRRGVLSFFYPKQLLRVSCIWLCYVDKCSSITLIKKFF